MSIGLRFFWLDDSEQLHALSIARHGRLFRGTEAAPQFAGKVARLIQVIVDIEDRKVTGIRSVGGHLQSFDARGYADRIAADHAALETLHNPVNAIRYRYEFRFEVSGRHRAEIEARLRGTRR